MPCPFFQPLQPVEKPQYPNARLPLLREFDGLCRASDSASAAPAEMRFRHCNQGNSPVRCIRYPADRPLASFRFDIVRSSPAELEILMLEEREYTPFAWQRFTYRPDSDALEPEVGDFVRRAQIVAFCHSLVHQWSNKPNG